MPLETRFGDKPSIVFSYSAFCAAKLQPALQSHAVQLSDTATFDLLSKQVVWFAQRLEEFARGGRTNAR